MSLKVSFIYLYMYTSKNKKCLCERKVNARSNLGNWRSLKVTKENIIYILRFMHKKYINTREIER